MTKKIRDVYAWVEEQEEYWDGLTSEKIKQLDDITNSHLDWFNKHATISDILSWKKPVINTSDKQEIQVDSESSGSSKNNNEITLDQQNSFTSSKVSIHEEEISLNKKSPALIQSQQRDSTSSEILDYHDDDDDEEEEEEESTDIHIAPELRKALKTISDTSNDNTLSQLSDHHDNREEITYSHIAPELRYLFNSNSDSSNDSQLLSHDQEESTDVHIAPEFRNVLETTVTTNNPLSIESSSLNDISIDDIRSITPESDTQLNTQSQNAPSTPKELDEVSPSLSVSPKRNYQMEDDDDDGDEIQLVVPKRHYEPESNKFILSPVRSSITQSPIRTASKHYTSPNRNLPQPPPLPSFNLSSPIRSQMTTLENTSPIRSQTTTLENTSPTKLQTSTLENTGLSPPNSKPPYQSPFMARLFKLTQSSGSSEDSKNFITVRPRPSESASSITSARDNDYNMNLLENKNKKRPMESVSESIEISDAIPQPHFKRSRTPNLRKASSVSNIPTPSSSTSTPPTPVNNINKEEEEEEHEYPIPSWAKSPELNKHLKIQEEMDPYSIFGPIPSLNLEEIFAHPETYLTEDDN